jgi:hypothetical protein
MIGEIMRLILTLTIDELYWERDVLWHSLHCWTRSSAQLYE